MATPTKEDVKDYLEGYGLDETALATLLQQLEEGRNTLEAWKERSESDWKDIMGKGAGVDIYNYLNPRNECILKPSIATVGETEETVGLSMEESNNTKFAKLEESIITLKEEIFNRRKQSPSILTLLKLF